MVQGGLWHLRNWHIIKKIRGVNPDLYIMQPVKIKYKYNYLHSTLECLLVCIIRGASHSSVYYSSTSQSASCVRCTQKWFRPFADVRNTRSPLSCSIMHVASAFIKFANLFFAFLDLGVTNAVCMVGCAGDEGNLAAIPCYYIRHRHSRRDLLCHLLSRHFRIGELANERKTATRMKSVPQMPIRPT